MGLTEIIAVIGGILKFWDSVVWLVKLLRDTPQEKHEEILKRIQAESRKLAETGRPTWD